MSLALGSLPLAWGAGVLSILSPCVWPLVPVVMSSAATGGRRGPWYLALGLSVSFALAGTLFSFLLINSGLDPELLRQISACLLIAVSLMILVKPLGDWLSLQLSRLSGRFDGLGGGNSSSAAGQFAVGGLLGLVWLPCVGPTLGAAIALASVGQDMGRAFLIMLAFGIGTAMTLLVAAVISTSVLTRVRPGLLAGAQQGKRLLGILLLALGIAVLTGADKRVEAVAVKYLPDWAVSF